ERQIFGSKSERLAILENAQQLPLAAMSSGESPATTAKLRTVSEHTRRVQQKDEVGEADSVPFFDETRVPVETITVPNPHTQGLTPDKYEVFSRWSLKERRIGDCRETTNTRLNIRRLQRSLYLKSKQDPTFRF